MNWGPKGTGSAGTDPAFRAAADRSMEDSAWNFWIVDARLGPFMADFGSPGRRSWIVGWPDEIHEFYIFRREFPNIQKSFTLLGRRAGNWVPDVVRSSRAAYGQLSDRRIQPRRRESRKQAINGPNGQFFRPDNLNF